MDKKEVIARLKEHLIAMKNQRGFNNSKDKFYCIHYIMDFLSLDNKQAKEFYKQNLEI